MRVLQVVKGRLISARYTVLHTAMHADTLFAIVCPDGSTAAAQKPCALRVYSLDICSAAPAWQLCSPCEQDDNCRYPLPRNQAACTDAGGKVCTSSHLSSSLIQHVLADMFAFPRERLCGVFPWYSSLWSKRHVGRIYLEL